MRKDRIPLLLLVVLSALMVLTACGSGGGGGGGGGGGNTLADGTFVKKYSPESLYGQMYGFAYHDTTASPYYLYNSTTLEDISMKHSSGYITAISLQRHWDQLGDVTCPTLTIKMGHTTVEDLTTTETDNYENGAGTFETVYDGSYTVPAGDAEAFFTVPLKSPFYFNGEDNLVVYFDHGSGCDGDVAVRHELGTGYDSGMWASLTHSALMHMKFHFEGGVDRITQGGSSTGQYAPFSTEAWSQKVQLLYKALEIHGSGPITGMALKIGTLTTNEIYTLDIKMGHTSLDALVSGSSYADNFSEPPVTVAIGSIWNVPAGVPAGDYVWLPFPDGVFKYNGVDNLLVEINVTSASGKFYPAFAGTPEDRVLFGYSGDETSLVAGNILYIASLRFRGGTMDVNSDHGVNHYKFNSSLPRKEQFLYRPVQLGTKGTITKIAYRLKNDSLSGTYDIKFVIGYATANDLNTGSFSGNLTGSVTVYNKMLSIPAGMKAGDWIEIPLSNPFNYDGESALVVQSAAPVSSINNPLFADCTSPRYDGQFVYNISDETSDTPEGSNSCILDQRLWLK